MLLMAMKHHPCSHALDQTTWSWDIIHFSSQHVSKSLHFDHTEAVTDYCCGKNIERIAFNAKIGPVQIQVRTARGLPNLHCAMKK